MVSRIVVEWKDKFDSHGQTLIEVYSSLSVFLSEHKEEVPPENTINNYISRAKTSFSNEKVRITRAKYISPETLKTSKKK